MNEISTHTIITVNESNKDRVKKLIIELTLEGAIDLRTADVICCGIECL